MLQWFNKQKNSISLSKDQPTNQENSSLPVLKEDDYEFLFNQLLDGVAHGWHKGRILKFFQDLEPRSNYLQWISWIKKLEQKVVYANDPSQRRIGAILVRLAEVTRSSDELKEFGRIAGKIGKKLLVAPTEDLILEYDGKDVVAETDEIDELDNSDIEEISEPLYLTEEQTEQTIDELNTDSDIEEISEPLYLTEEQTEQTIELNHDEAETIEFVDRQTFDTATVTEETVTELSAELDSIIHFTEQSTQNSDFITELEDSDTEEIELEQSQNNPIESVEEFTEQLTILQENSVPAQKTETIAQSIEQPTQSTDFVSESVTQEETINEVNNSKSIESLAALTEQLTVLQDEDNSELDISDEIDSDLDLFASENDRNGSETPVSVASFLEATKALVPQTNNQNVTSLSWGEFVSVLEQDPILAKQVAQHLQLSSSDPDDIVRAAVNKIVHQQEVAQLPDDTVELVKNWFELGLKQASAEDFQGAIASWDKALEINPHLSEAWHNRGSALGRLEKYEEAIQSFNKAIKISPERHQAWNDRAHALYQIQKWQQAVESWDKAISIMSDNYQFWYNRGCALEQLQRYDDSISSYEKTLEIKPDFQPARSRYISLVTERSSSTSN